MDAITILTINIILYTASSLVFLVVGGIMGINRLIGILLILSIIIYVIYMMIISVNSDAEIGMWESIEPLTLIGSLVAGFTGPYWYNIGKNFTYKR